MASSLLINVCSTNLGETGRTPKRDGDALAFTGPGDGANDAIDFALCLLRGLYLTRERRRDWWVSPQRLDHEGGHRREHVAVQHVEAARRPPDATAIDALGIDAARDLAGGAANAVIGLE